MVSSIGPTVEVRNNYYRENSIAFSSGGVYLVYGIAASEARIEWEGSRKADGHHGQWEQSAIYLQT